MGNGGLKTSLRQRLSGLSVMQFRLGSGICMSELTRHSISSMFCMFLNL